MSTRLGVSVRRTFRFIFTLCILAAALGMASTPSRAAGPPAPVPITSGGPALAADDSPLAAMTTSTLAWNTFIGGYPGEVAQAVALDASGNIYLAGRAEATWGSPINPFTPGGDDALVVKLNSAGQYQWHSYLGGTGDDNAYDIVVGSTYVYVAGTSHLAWTCASPCTAPGFPFDGGDSDGFGAQLDLTGKLIGNAFFGGTGTDEALGFALDAAGTHAVVVGYSTVAWSCGLPCVVKQPFKGNFDAFDVKIDLGSGLPEWISFLGSVTGHDEGRAVVMDAFGNSYVVGTSTATWGSPKRAYVSGTDGFAAKVLADGSLEGHTFLGGPYEDEAAALAMDSGGNFYIAGHGDTAWGCVSDCTVRDYTWSDDGFVAKIAGSTGDLAWNTFLGGGAMDMVMGLDVDSSGDVYVAGASMSTWGTPMLPYTGAVDAFAAKLGPSGALAAHIFLGGSTDDMAADIVVDAQHVAYVVGASDATWGTPVAPYAGGIVDAFAAQTDFGIYAKSKASHDGWILESGETTSTGGTKNSGGTVLKLGDQAGNEQYRAILSFDTSSLPDDAMIETVELRIRKAGRVGSNPFNVLGDLLADIRTGSFKNNSSLQLGDWKAGSSQGSAFSFGNTPKGDWYFDRLAAAEFDHINRTGLTQIRLRFTRGDNNDSGADYLKFYSGNASGGQRPMLTIVFSVP